MATNQQSFLGVDHRSSAESTTISNIAGAVIQAVRQQLNRNSVDIPGQSQMHSGEL